MVSDKMNITLRPYQEQAIQSIFDYFMEKSGSPVLALPTGTGKSILPAVFIYRVLSMWPNQRFLLGTHVKELISQNAKQLLKVWPNAPLAICSAGLKRKETALPIVYGGIATMVGMAEQIGHRDIFFIDEAHLVSPNDETMYQFFIKKLREINPRMKVIGLSATPFRQGLGYITEGGIFTDFCYNITGYKEFNQLIEDGYLCPVFPRKTNYMLDVSGVKTVNGDFALGDLEKAVNTDEITFNALQEVLAAGVDRKSWMVFTSGVAHADAVARMLVSMGIPAAAVHSKMPAEQRDKNIAAFKAGILRAVTNNNVLTTGFDHPPVDLLAILRPTKSASLWVQMVGRGTRPSPGKRNCLALDFAGNTLRNGPINDPVIPRRKGEGVGEIPVKICEAQRMVKGVGCGTYNHISARYCDDCQAEFRIQTELKMQSSDVALLRTTKDEPIEVELPVREWKTVDYAMYRSHKKIGGVACLRAVYHSGMQTFNEYVHFEAKGGPLAKAHDWWKKRSNEPPPVTVEHALQYISRLKKPARVEVHLNHKDRPKILNVEFEQ